MSGVVLTGTRMESIVLLGSLPAEVQAVVRPLVQPLLEQWDSLVGDHEAVHEAAERWRAMGRHVDDLGAPPAPRGRGHRAGVGRPRPARLGGRRHRGRHRARGAGRAVPSTSVPASTRRRAPCGRPSGWCASWSRELVEWAALTLAVSAVTGLVTLGASTLAGAATAAARAAVTGSRIADAGRGASPRCCTASRTGSTPTAPGSRACPPCVAWSSSGRRSRSSSVVVKKPLRGEIADATGMDGQLREPLGRWSMRGAGAPGAGDDDPALGARSAEARSVGAQSAEAMCTSASPELTSGCSVRPMTMPVRSACTSRSVLPNESNSAPSRSPLGDLLAQGRVEVEDAGAPGADPAAGAALDAGRWSARRPRPSTMPRAASTRRTPSDAGVDRVGVEAQALAGLVEQHRRAALAGGVPQRAVADAGVQHHRRRRTPRPGRG